MVYRIVVHQGGQMNQLDYRRQRNRTGVRLASDLVGKERQRGPEELSAQHRQVGVHLFDLVEVRNDDATEFVDHPFQATRDRSLDERHPRKSLGPHNRISCRGRQRSFRSRSVTSAKLMSSEKT